LGSQGEGREARRKGRLVWQDERSEKQDEGLDDEARRKVYNILDDKTER